MQRTDFNRRTVYIGCKCAFDAFLIKRKEDKQRVKCFKLWEARERRDNINVD